MRRLLIIPAAGLGSRLHAPTAKALVPVNGRPMVDHLLDLYRSLVERIVVVAHPSFVDAVTDWAHARASRTLAIDVVTQPTPTGMLDAIRIPRAIVEHEQPDWIWVTWCDQIGVLPETVARLMAVTDRTPPPAMAIPTAKGRDPYTHLVRNAEERIMRILHRREGDRMPVEGESDMGLFVLSRDAYLRELSEYASEPSVGGGTGERNFLPFIPWLAGRARVVTIPATDPMEAVGINTADDLAAVESWMRTRSGDDR